MLKSLKPLLNPVKPTKQPSNQATKQPSNLTPQTGKIPIVGVKSFGNPDPVLVANAETPVPEPSSEPNPTLPSSSNASDLGAPITNPNPGNVIIGGDNNGLVNTGGITGIINLDPTRRTSRNSSNLSANIKIRFTNGENGGIVLDEASLNLNIATDSTQTRSSSNLQTNTDHSTVLGFEIGYKRRDIQKPDPKRIEGMKKNGELVRATEGGDILRFSFLPGDQPDSKDRILSIVIDSTGKKAVAQVERPDGTVFPAEAVAK